jgi:hypothetical protein
MVHVSFANPNVLFVHLQVIDAAVSSYVDVTERYQSGGMWCRCIRRLFEPKRGASYDPESDERHMIV